MIMLYLVGLGFACQGCAPLWQSARTSLVQPFIYRRISTDYHECRRNRELADEAWGSFFSKHPTLEYSKDFECGFKEGFSDYLYSGGTGAPPPVPPRCYWNYKYETPEGHKAAQNWFAGFRAGAESARESGYRKLVLVATSTCIPTSGTQMSPLPSPSQSAAPDKSPGSGTGMEEMLPPPKPVPNSDKPATEKSPTSEPPPPPAPSRPPEETPPRFQQTSDLVDPPIPPPYPAELIPRRPEPKNGALKTGSGPSIRLGANEP
jgi:hypothetical protein